LWAEPINALMSLAFLAAAWASWQLARRSGTLDGSTGLLIALMATVGIGSGLFHTFATTWARVLDVLPILIFQLLFLWLYLRRVVWLDWPYSALAVGGLLIAALIGRLFPAFLNGSLTYLPALVVLIALGVYHYKVQKQERLALLAASGVFALALFFRTIDEAACPYIPFGTHFLWHVLNAVVLFLVSLGLVRNLGATEFNEISGSR